MIKYMLFDKHMLSTSEDKDRQRHNFEPRQQSVEERKSQRQLYSNHASST